jgi:hypothetical protein
MGKTAEWDNKMYTTHGRKSGRTPPEMMTNQGLDSKWVRGCTRNTKRIEKDSTLIGETDIEESSACSLKPFGMPILPKSARSRHEPQTKPTAQESSRQYLSTSCRSLTKAMEP